LENFSLKEESFYPEDELRTGHSSVKNSNHSVAFHS